MTQSPSPNDPNQPDDDPHALYKLEEKIEDITNRATDNSISGILNTVVILMIFVMIFWELPNATMQEFERRAIIIGNTLILEYLLILSIQFFLHIYLSYRGYSGIWSSMIGVVFAHIIYKTYRIIKRKENIRKHLVFYLILIIHIIIFAIVNAYYWQNEQVVLYRHYLATFGAIIAHGIVISAVQAIFKL